VEQFEQRYLDFPGLNLTFEVREGIVKHSRDYAGAEHPELAEFLLELRPPLEAQLIDCVDEIAYNTADLDDAREAELLDTEALREEAPLFEAAWAEVEAEHRAGSDTAWGKLEPGKIEKLKFNEALKLVLNILATDLIETTAERVASSGARSTEDIRRAPRRLAGFSEAAGRGNAQLKRFLFAHIYEHAAITLERDRSVQCLTELFGFYLETPGSMPAAYEESAMSEARQVVVCDYIAGMTDHYLLRQHAERFASRKEQGEAQR
jgi:dGTPase